MTTPLEVVIKTTVEGLKVFTSTQTDRLLGSRQLIAELMAPAILSGVARADDLEEAIVDAVCDLDLKLATHDVGLIGASVSEAVRKWLTDG